MEKIYLDKANEDNKCYDLSDIERMNTMTCDSYIQTIDKLIAMVKHSNKHKTIQTVAILSFVFLLFVAIIIAGYLLMATPIK